MNAPTLLSVHSSTPSHLPPSVPKLPPYHKSHAMAPTPSHAPSAILPRSKFHPQPYKLKRVHARRELPPERNLASSRAPTLMISVPAATHEVRADAPQIFSVERSARQSWPI